MDSNLGIMTMVYELKKKCALVDQQLMDELKLSQSELLFFTSLDRCLTVSSPELCKNMGLSASRVSRVIDKLVQNGYLNREVDAKDRRAITLCLTEEGKGIKTRIDEGRKACENRLLEIIPDSDIDKFREIVSCIVTKL